MVETKRLKDYFKRVLVCTKCKIKYGTDAEKDNNLCPLCSDQGKNFRKNKDGKN